ncbi:hypothetical protein AMTRI_Chr04g182730 [Amborella trichopoda]|uniref:EF-hand domain-containing protein n=1 Tax=Amborella trichopoda TaxID=13333 RepID=W1NJD6_AMBTC|nr:polcalcin Jun o 2 [Amborella trichopoda]ERM95275.1 hypothetical protein AMTR_s00008p00069660 [Amborella trichopoda]|eukprot:XP_006827859.1 polcalcin Jun o 2 [Amborella trichopoda]
MAQNQQLVLSGSPSLRTGGLHPARDLLRLQQAFQAFDANGNGLISALELEGIMKSLGCDSSKHLPEEIMKQGDQNRDRLVSINVGDIFKDVFEKLDLNGNRVVSDEELEGLAPEEGQELMWLFIGMGCCPDFED